MRITRLDLQGFKSFVERTHLEFGAGVAGIVGPNGCGKSNVVDAIRWVLGEQHPKTLRGKRMEDMVFNGSDGRRPAAMAEVTMILSDVDDRLSEQWAVGDEVQVTRRLYRSGDSEYLINQKVCRLRDIVDLFLDTGLNTHSFSIVEQGRIESLLTARIEDRREVIEEAAGIMKYKTRRNEALRKLQSAKDNLDRINDIVVEVERQTRSLERQAKRAAQYKEIQERLREADGRLLRADYAALEAKIDPRQQGYDDKKREEGELRSEWSAADGKVEERRQKMAQREEALNRLLVQLRDADAEAQRLETRIELYRDQDRALEATAEGREEEWKTLDAELTATSETLSRVRNEFETHSNRVQEAELVLSARQREVEEARARLAEQEEAVEGERARVQELTGRFTRTENQNQLFQSQLESLREKKSQMEDARRRDMNRRQEAHETLHQGIARRERITADLGDLRRGESAAKEELQRATESLTTTENSLYLLREELAAKSSSLTATESMANSFDDAGWAELSGPKAAEAGVGGVIGPLTDLLEIQPGYEKAIEAVLGNRLRATIVEGLAEAKSALEFLKRSISGRSTLIPKNLRRVSASVKLDPMRLVTGDESSGGSMSLNSGVLGSAADFVRMPAGYAGLLDGLLGDVRIVRDFGSAVSIWRQGGNHGILATLEGDVVYPTGIVLGGSDGDGILQTRKRIEVLREEAEELKRKVGRAEDARASAKGRCAERQEAMEEAGRAVRETEAALAEIDRETDKLTASMNHLDEILEESSREFGRMAQEERSLGARMQEAQEVLDKIEVETAESEGRVERNAKALADGRGRIEEAVEAVSAQRVELAEQKARAENIEADLRRGGERASEIRNRMDRMASDAETDRNKREELKKADEEARNRIRFLHDQREEWRVEAKDCEDAIALDRDYVREVQERARSLKDRVTALAEELDEIFTGLSALKVERDLLCQRAQLTYGVDLTAAPVRPEDSEISQEERETLREESVALQDRLGRMGEVNMGALSEFEQLNERYQFLKSQQEDLVQSIQTLHDTIDRINRTTRRRFKTAFDSINETFSEVFRRLFGGGRASLILTDESNLLETGVDIVVQPPGKKLGNILLLSAGEKALTAISLLFAIFRYNPSPFCLLDEVDATLDDHNVARFIDILRELSLKTQFIVITHNKRTMSFADVLYGVTMAEKGASNVVSVDLHQISPASGEAAKTRESRREESLPEVKDLELEEDRWGDIEPIEESEAEDLRPLSKANGQNGSAQKAEKTNGGPVHLDDEREISAEEGTEDAESVPEESILPPSS